MAVLLDTLSPRHSCINNTISFKFLHGQERGKMLEAQGNLDIHDFSLRGVVILKMILRKLIILSRMLTKGSFTAEWYLKYLF